MVGVIWGVLGRVVGPSYSYRDVLFGLSTLQEVVLSLPFEPSEQVPSAIMAPLCLEAGLGLPCPLATGKQFLGPFCALLSGRASGHCEGCCFCPPPSLLPTPLLLTGCLQQLPEAISPLLF